MNKYDVRNNEKLRASFNELTRKTFGFDFVNWYDKGHWQEKYIPYVCIKDDKVVSNVSVNIMDFEVNGEVKHLIQLGTVMTDEEYRGQGLNRQLMEEILEEYQGKVDGIYLFGNDSVLEYYPKFGFKPAKEYEYSKAVQKGAHGYEIEKVDMSDEAACQRLYAAITGGCANDGFFMCDNLGLYQFWLVWNMENVYYVPEAEAYVIAEAENGRLFISQVFGGKELDMDRFAVAVGALVEGGLEEISLGYTPINKESYTVKEHKEEDCTLFVLGTELEKMLEDKIIFPIMSHA